jgi:FkbM family methyltransferase
MNKNYLIDKLKKLQILLGTPGSFQARWKGCYFELYKIAYRLKKMGIFPRTVLDIGANRGMFTKCMNLVYPSAKIYAFEPLSECFSELLKLGESIKYFKCYNVALGDESKEEMFHRNIYDYSSSFLEMTDIHREAFPYTLDTYKEVVSIEKLDNILSSENLESPVLMKIDVQGYEDKVFKGAKHILLKTDYIICELSFTPLYKDQPLFDDLYIMLKNLGFQYRGHIDFRDHPNTTEILHVDGLFIRKDR